MAKDKTDMTLGFANIGLMVGMSAFALHIIEEMNKMFGETIPKGVVKEMMEGVVSGIIDAFEIKLYDKDAEIKRLNDKLSELSDKNEELKIEIERLSPKKK